MVAFASVSHQSRKAKDGLRSRVLREHGTERISFRKGRILLHLYCVKTAFPCQAGCNSISRNTWFGLGCSEVGEAHWSLGQI